MAYTAKSTFNDAVLSDADKLRIAGFKQAYNNAKTQDEKKAAHAGAEAVRAASGYSGGDGSQYIALNQTQKQQVTDPMTEFNNYQNQLKEQQKQASIASLSKTYNDTLSNLNSEKSAIQPAYYNKRNQASSSSQTNATNFAEYLANRGLTNSGSAAQGEINRTTQLQGDITNLNQQEQAANEDIARRSTQAQQAYASDLASSNAGIEATALQNSLSEWQRQQTQKAEDAKWNQQFDYTKSRDAVGDTRYNTEYTDKTKQQNWENNFNQSQFNYQKQRDSVADTQWQQNMNLDLRKQSFSEAEQKISDAMQNKQISISAGNEALSWAKFNSDNDPNSLDNQLKQQQISINKTSKDAAAFNDIIANTDSLYTYKNPTTGEISVNPTSKTALRNYIVGLNLSDAQTDQMLLRYGLPVNP